MSLAELLTQIRQCDLCHQHLSHGANPIVQAGESARLLIIGQAPGLRVHQTGIPWNDPSGDRLRQWLQITPADFYNSEKVAIVPMGLCYPGKGKSGDLAPRKECAPLWHSQIFQELPNIELTLVIGQYAQNRYLTSKPKTLTETVKNWQRWNSMIPLPHPSPRNAIWLKKNPWFEAQVVPELRAKVAKLALTHQ